MHPSEHPLFAALLLAVVAFVVWRWLAILFPFVACSRCSGRSKQTQPGGRAFRACGRCGGSGKKLRLGARLFGVDAATGRRAGHR